MNAQTQIDFYKCKAAMERIYVKGICNSKAREAIIEEAIKLIGENPVEAFSKRYIGTKDYAHFKDQSVECEYGYGPKHGNVVFSIGRVNQGINLPELGEDEIYFLMACRDFKGFEVGNGKPALSLPQVVNAVSSAKAELLLKGSVFSDLEPIADKGAVRCALNELVGYGFECEAGNIKESLPFIRAQQLVGAA